jgi:hypothetical protein
VIQLTTWLYYRFEEVFLPLSSSTWVGRCGARARPWGLGCGAHSWDMMNH